MRIKLYYGVDQPPSPNCSCNEYSGDPSVGEQLCQHDSGRKQRLVTSRHCNTNIIDSQEHLEICEGTTKNRAGTSNIKEIERTQEK